MAQNEPDPHADLHELAATEHTDHAPVAFAGEESVDEKIAKLNKALTGRINDLRKDFDTTRKAVSGSVQTLTNDVASLKTLVENNKASIDAQDKLIEGAGKRADAAKKAADDATALIASVVERRLPELERTLHDLHTTYQTHTHTVTVTFSGQTAPPAPGDSGFPTGQEARQ